jgi:hypothetical protein
MRTAVDLVHALRNPSPAAPFAQHSDEKLNAIAKLTEIFEAAVTPAAQPPRVLHPAVPPPRVPNTAVPPPRVPSTHTPPPRVPPNRPLTHRYPTRARTPTSFTANAVQALIDAPDLTAQIKTQLYSTLPEEFSHQLRHRSLHWSLHGIPRTHFESFNQKSLATFKRQRIWSPFPGFWRSCHWYQHLLLH